MDRRSDHATAVDVEINPQRHRLSRSQTNFALEAIVECRVAKQNESQCCCADILMAMKCAAVSRWAAKKEDAKTRRACARRYWMAGSNHQTTLARHHYHSVEGHIDRLCMAAAQQGRTGNHRSAEEARLACERNLRAVQLALPVLTPRHDHEMTSSRHRSHPFIHHPAAPSTVTNQAPSEPDGLCRQASPPSVAS